MPTQRKTIHVMSRVKTIWPFKDVRVPLFPFHSLPVVSVATVVANFKRTKTYCLLEAFCPQFCLAVYSGGTEIYLVKYEN